MVKGVAADLKPVSSSFDIVADRFEDGAEVSLAGCWNGFAIRVEDAEKIVAGRGIKHSLRGVKVDQRNAGTGGDGREALVPVVDRYRAPVAEFGAVE